MNATNKVQLTGNLGRDPELKTFEKGGKLVKFSIATNEEYFVNGEKRTETNWHNLSAWGKLAERVAGELRKGSFVSIEGRLKTRDYTDKSGQKRYVTEVLINDYVLRPKAESDPNRMTAQG
jgi:single-strand DNA-binding protein